MPLITCPDCGKQVSDQAPACPNCGCPIQTTVSPEKTQTIEATAKSWKGMQLIGGLSICLGVVSCVYLISDPTSSGTTTAIFLILGLILMICGKFGAWWYHE